MADDTRLELLITAQSDQFKRELAGVNSQLDKMTASHKKSMDGIGAGFKSALPDVSKFALGAGAVALAFDQVSASIGRVIAKETALAQFSALTGVTGDKLKEFGIVAEEMAVKFGTTAVDNIESFKGVLSRLGPGFASSTEAVKVLGENINIMAKAGGIDAKESMDALTTVMLQFGIDLSDPNAAAAESTRIMNTLAAGAQQGAAEIPQVAEAMKQVGVMAKGLNQSIEGTNAALQILAAGGKYGSEAGVALRNTMALMVKASGPAEVAMKTLGTSSKELGEILTTKGLNAALTKLQSGLDTVKSDAEKSALMFNIFGAENAAAATILANSTKEINGQSSALTAMTTAVTGTNSAVEQFGVVSDTTAAKVAKFKQGFNNAIDAFTTKAMVETTTTFEKFGNLFSTNGPTDSGFKNLIYNMTRAGMSTEALAEMDAKLDAEQKRVNRSMAEHSKTLSTLPMQMQTATNFLYQNAAALAAQAEAAKKAKQTIDEMRNAPPPPPPKTLQQMSMDELDALKKAEEAAWRGMAPGPVATAKLAYLKKVEAEIKRRDPKEKAAKGKSQKDPIEFFNSLGITPLSEVLKAEQQAATKEADALANLMTSLWEDMMPKSKGADDPMLLASEGMGLQFDATTDMLDRLVAMSGVADITLQTLADTMATAFTAPEDAMKAALKGVASTIISMVEGMILAGSAFASVSAILTAGFSAFKDAPLLAAAIIALEASRGIINSFAVGTPYVPNDQLAQIHRGEMIVPATFASAVRRGEMSITGGAGQGASARVAPRRKERVSVNQSVGASAFRSVVQNNSWREASRTA